MSKPILYLMLGYPGAGKTTAAVFIQQLTGAERLTSDEERVKLFDKPQFTPEEHAVLYKKLDERTEQLLAEGKSVIYDANLNRYIHRQEKYDICKRTGAKPVLVWVNTPRQLAKQRAIHDSRQHLWPPNEAPNAMFERIAGVIEPPKDSEHALAVDGSHISQETIKKLLAL